MRFYQLDIFAEAPYRGNPLAVFPNAPDLDGPQMQAIARELNLSETTFVTGTRPQGYDVRIFTPAEELRFAGHPTLGTAWLLRDLGLIEGDAVVQMSAAGETEVSFEDDLVRFARSGRAEEDLEDHHPQLARGLAEAIGLEPSALGLEARELGRSGMLRPAVADAGLRQLMLPVKNLEALAASRPPLSLPDELNVDGAYAFTAVGAGKIAARGYFPGVGINEDPGTGSAAAALGVYLADRVGRIEFALSQGDDIGRPSRMEIDADQGRVTVGGRVVPILEGELKALP